MKRNITLAVEKSLLSRARKIAAQRGASVSAMLAQELLKIVEQSQLRLMRAAPAHLIEKTGSRH